MSETGGLEACKIKAFLITFWPIRKEYLVDRGAMVTQKRVALYARVSKMDKGQDPETQLISLREYAKRRGFLHSGEYIDYASGTRDDRPQYQALLAAVRKRQVDVVLVWRYDRFARSTQALIGSVLKVEIDCD